MLNISENNLVKILKYGVYASLAWFFIITPTALYPVHSGKVFFLEVLIEILFIFYILLIVRFPQYRPKLNLLTTGIAIWFGAMILSAILGADFWASFLGQFKRITGIFYTAHIVVLFLIIAAVFRDWRDWEKFFIVNVVIGLVHSAIAIYQKFVPILAWMVPGEDVERVAGLFSNPSYFASYAVFPLFFSIFLAVRARDVRVKIFNIISFAAIFIAMLFAGTRGTLAGSLIGFAIILFVYAIFSKNKKARIVLASSFTVLTIVGLFLWANQNKPWMDSMPTIKRAFNLSLAEFATSTRKVFWKSAIDGFKEKPVFGWGPENFNLIFDKYYDPKIVAGSNMGESWPSKPHNIFIEYLSGGGVVGLLSFLFLFVSAGYSLFKNFRNHPENLDVFAVFSALIAAHLIQNFFLFDTFYTLYMLAVVFGLVYYLSENNKQIFSDKPLKKDSEKMILFFLLAVVLPLVYMNISTFRAGRYVNSYNLKFLDMPSFYRDDNTMSYIKFYLDERFYFSDNNKKNKMLERMSEEMKDVSKRHPGNMFAASFLIQTLTELGAMDKGGGYLDEAEKLAKDAIAVNPNRQHMYLFLGRIYLLRDDYAASIANYKKAIELNPESSIGHWYVGLALYGNKQKEEALKEFDIAYDSGFRPENGSQLGFWGLFYAESGDFGKAIVLYEKASQKDPTNADYFKKLAIIYANIGDKEMAIKMADKAASLDPKLKEEAEMFKKRLEQ